jgi:hypothetical protein
MMISSSIHLPENDIILFFFMTKNSKDSTRRLLDLIHTFSKVAVYKINVQKSVTFLYINNEQTEKELRETIPFTIASKKKKKNEIPKNKFNEGNQRPFQKNHKSLKREIKEDIRRWKALPCLLIGRINMVNTF